MNGYPFAGPGGQKTLHRQVAEQHASDPRDARYVALVNTFAPYMPPQQVYYAIMEYDNR